MMQKSVTIQIYVPHAKWFLAAIWLFGSFLVDVLIVKYRLVAAEKERGLHRHCCAWLMVIY